MVPSYFVNQAQIATVVDDAMRKLGPEAVRVRYNIGEDWSGDPAIFFRIVLSDAASTEETLADVSGNIATILFDEIRPHENWGLLPYFSFRGESEQAKRSDPEWS